MNNKQLSIVFKQALLSLLFFLLSTVGFAQKLPNVQTISLRPRGKVKIDGITSDWGDKFQAYNHNIQAFYTLANDDENLYLLIQAVEPLIERKILAGGITFTINPSKKNDNAVAITYPNLDKNHWSNINLRDKPIITKDSVISSKQVDSFMRVVNTKLAVNAKEIKIIGAKALKDTLISIYNLYGIKTAQRFDHKITYTYELAMPLKYLGLSINDPLAFNYNIRFNGSTTAEGSTIEQIEGGTRINWTDKNHASLPDMKVMGYPTDLTGSYVLAKK